MRRTFLPLALAAVAASVLPASGAAPSLEQRAASPLVVANAQRMGRPPGEGPVEPPPVDLPVSGARPVSAYTAWPGNMPYYGGPVLRSPKAYVVFWGWRRTEAPGYARTLTGFLRGVGGSSWLGVTRQYYDEDAAGQRHLVLNPRDQLRGVWYDPVGPPRDGYAETLLGPEAVRAARHFGVLGDRDAVVLVASPPGRNPAGFVDGDYCGWHSWTAGLAFINLPYLGDECGSAYVQDEYDGVTLVAGHEYSEAITDPAVGYDPAWRDITWQEDADKCERIPPGAPGGAVVITLPTGRYAVQQHWSNAALQGLGDCAAG